MPTKPPQTGNGHHVCPGLRGLSSPTHHVLSRACCFSCSSRFRLSTSTFSSMFYGAGRRWVGCPHACLDTPAPLPTGMKKWHGGPPCHGRALGAPVSEWHGRHFSLSAPGWGVPTPSVCPQTCTATHPGLGTPSSTLSPLLPKETRGKLPTAAPPAPVPEALPGIPSGYTAPPHSLPGKRGNPLTPSPTGTHPPVDIVPAVLALLLDALLQKVDAELEAEILLFEVIEVLRERAVPVSHGRRSMRRASRHPSHGAAGTQPRLPARPQLPSLAPLLSLSSFFFVRLPELFEESLERGQRVGETRAPEAPTRRSREGGEGSVAPGRARPLCRRHLPRRCHQGTCHESCEHPAGAVRVPAPRGLTCSKSRRVCVWARGPISRSRRRHVCAKGSGWGWAPAGPLHPLGSAGTGSSSASPHSPSWEAGREQGRAAVRPAKRLLHASCPPEERRDKGTAQSPESPRPSPGDAGHAGYRGSRGALPAMPPAPGTTAGTVSLPQGSLREQHTQPVTHSTGGPPVPPRAVPQGPGRVTGCHWCLRTRGDTRVCPTAAGQRL